jgi:pyruvate dehydrogenase E1 component alpha subunit
MRAGITALADPDPLSVFDNVYAEPHTGLARQRDHYSRYLRTFVGSDGR